MSEPSLLLADALYAVERLRQLVPPGLLGEEHRRHLDAIEAVVRDGEAERLRMAGMLLEVE